MSWLRFSEAAGRRRLSVASQRRGCLWQHVEVSASEYPAKGFYMTVLKQHHAPGMPAEAYDQVAAGAMPSQRKADGFVAHYAIVEDGGITVIEIWDSIAQHDAWFNEAVRPHLPPGVPEPKFADLHNSNTR